MIDDADVLCIGSFFHVMRRQKDGHPKFFLQRNDCFPDLLSRCRIKSRRRFIQKQDLGFVHQCRRNLCPAFLTSGKFSVRSVQKIFQPKKFDDFVKIFPEIFLSLAIKSPANLQIFLDRQQLIKGIFLMNHPDVLPNFFIVLSDFVSQNTHASAVFFI